MASRRLRRPYQVKPKVRRSTASPSNRRVQPFAQHDRTRQHHQRNTAPATLRRGRSTGLPSLVLLTFANHTKDSFLGKSEASAAGRGAKLEGCEVIETRMVTDQSKIEPLSRPSALGTSSGIAAFASLVTKKIIYSLSFVSLATQETLLKPPPRD